MKSRSLLLNLLAASAALHGELRAQNTSGCITGWFGGNPASQFGAAVSDAGDVNKDGFSDVVVGAPSEGTVSVFSGKEGSLLWKLNAAAGEGLFGSAVAGAGDLDGDGQADILVGIPLGGAQTSGAGLVKAISGKTGAVIHAVVGSKGGDRFGSSIASVGDADLDGVEDFVVGAPAYFTAPCKNFGYVRLVSGKTGATLFQIVGQINEAQLGYAVDGVGDVDLDGRADFLASAPFEGYPTDCSLPPPTQEGAVRIYSGMNGSEIFKINGNSPDANLGLSVRGADDLDLDGVPDFLAIGLGSDGYRYIVAYSGKNLGSALFELNNLAETPGANFGQSFDGGRDVNGDGYPDVVVGNPESDPGSFGEICLFSGKDGSLLAKQQDLFPGSAFGASVSLVADSNGQGLADWIVGAPQSDAAYLTTGEGTAWPFGKGCQGSYGFTPELSLHGCFTPGGALTVSVSEAYGGSVAYLIVGTQTASVPVGIPSVGCKINVLANIAVLPFPLGGSGPGNGSVQIPAALPSAIPLSSIALQAFAIDPFALNGYSSTNGVFVNTLY